MKKHLRGQAIQKIDYEQELVNDIMGFQHDPYGFVCYAYPWGEKGPLKNESGPDIWQRNILELVGHETKISSEALQVAVSSGHGIGKTALIAWLIQWFISTREHPQIVCTANTKPQLETKTWRELAKWWKMAINRHWFQWTATKFWQRAHRETWFASAIPWSKERSEAFAGTHERNVMMLYDEASLIDDMIWEVTEGAMTTPGAIWIAFGNPTRNTGRFKECFGKYRHRWKTYRIDSRTAKMADQGQITKWIDDYGEDSDFVRVRVRGVHPRASSMQFIPVDIVEAATGKTLHLTQYVHAPKIIGVDVARFGDDQSVIYKRQGLATIDVQKYRELDTMTLAGKISLEIRQWKPDAVFVDVNGIGAGVVDRLHQLQYDQVIGIHFGARADDENRYYNKRTEMWGRMKDWLVAGGAIQSDNELHDDLIGPEYGFDPKDRVQLEKKEDMKKRGIASPDTGDALALTFAQHVEHKMDRLWQDPEKYSTEQYDPLNYDMGG